MILFIQTQICYAVAEHYDPINGFFRVLNYFKATECDNLHAVDFHDFMLMNHVANSRHPNFFLKDLIK